MKWVNTVISAILILMGAASIALWAVSTVAVSAVEDGTAVHGIAVRALDDPEIVAALGETLADGAVDALAERGIDPSRLGLERALRTLIENEVATDEFRDALLEQIDAGHEQFATQLTQVLGEPAPLVLEVDPSAYVNTRIASIPVVGAGIPPITMPPLPVEVLDAQTFEDVRSVYSLMELASPWALWLGIAFIVIGMFVTLRFRWFLAKTGLAIGAVTGGLWLILRLWGVDGIVRVLPGRSGGSLGTLLTRVMTEETVPALESRLLVVAAAALILALAFFMIGILTMPRGKQPARP